MPSGRSAYCATSSATRSQSPGSTCSGVQITRREVPQKPDFGGRAKPRGQKVSDLGDDEDRHHDRTSVILEESQRLDVVGVVGVDVRVQRAGIGQQAGQVSSSRRISSIRSETSRRPLRPAAAAAGDAAAHRGAR